MMTASEQTSRAAAATPRSGLPYGAEVMTLSGTKSVETLRIGDRVITRAGARVLRDVVPHQTGFCLEFDSPQVVLLSAAQVHSDTGAPFAA